MVSCPVQGRAHILFPCERGETALVRLRFKSKGFAFIEMEDDAAAAKAIAELNGAEYMGRTMVAVSYTHLDVYKRQPFSLR